MRVSNIGKRLKTLKNFQVPSFCLTFRHFFGPPPTIHSHTQLVKDVTVVVAMVANTIDKQLDIVNKPVEQLLSLYVHH